MKNDYLSKQPKHPTTIGGEALIEGVMMRGPENIAIAIRKNDGSIQIEKKPLKTLAKRSKFFKLPIIRGAVGIIESMVIGMKALMFSADAIEIEEVETKSKLYTWLESRIGNKFNSFMGKFYKHLEDVMVYVSVAIALVLGIGLFMVLPYFCAELVGFNKSTSLGWASYNAFEGIVRIALFFGYIILISKMNDIKRVFQYHGAEHKTIHCYENEEELTVENVKKFTTKHPRCGTAFLFVVMLVSIVVFSFIKSDNGIINVASRLILIPLVAGISYEIIKYSAKSKLRAVRALSLPGLFLQRFTTIEPDDSQIEVAIEALKNVLVEDRNADLAS